MLPQVNFDLCFGLSVVERIHLAYTCTLVFVFHICSLYYVIFKSLSDFLNPLIKQILFPINEHQFQNESIHFAQ